MLTTAEIDRVTDEAREQASAAASWIFDGNSAERDYSECVRMHEDGDPAWDDAFGYPTGPLSGEYADGWTPDDVAELIERDRYATDDAAEWDVREACDYFEDAFRDRYVEDVVHAAMRHLGLVEV